MRVDGAVTYPDQPHSTAARVNMMMAHRNQQSEGMSGDTQPITEQQTRSGKSPHIG